MFHAAVSGKGASRRFDAEKPAASALPLIESGTVHLDHFKNWYSASFILKELATEESLAGSRRSFTSCLGSG